MVQIFVDDTEAPVGSNGEVILTTKVQNIESTENVHDESLQNTEEDSNKKDQLDDSKVQENKKRMLVYSKEDFAEDTVEDVSSLSDDISFSSS